MAPPLPPKPLGTYLTGYPSEPPTVEVECYIDLVCPFSAKMFLTLYEDVLPAIQADDAKKAAISIKIHHVVQPWHPQSTMVHEAALAVKKVESDEVYLMYFQWICKQFTDEKKQFSDADTWSKSRRDIYGDLLLGLVDFDGDIRYKSKPDTPDNVMKLLDHFGKDAVGNCGNGVTQDIKWACKHHRAKGVHVTPTVFANDIEAVQVSSGWNCDDWMKFFDSFGL